MQKTIADAMSPNEEIKNGDFNKDMEAVDRKISKLQFKQKRNPTSEGPFAVGRSLAMTRINRPSNGADDQTRSSLSGSNSNNGSVSKTKGRTGRTRLRSDD
jgi:hypothetical protein